MNNDTKTALNERLLSLVPRGAQKIDTIEMWQKMEPGYYYGVHKNGNLAFLAHVCSKDSKIQDHEGSVVDSLLMISENLDAGRYQELMWGQAFYNNNQMEDFSPWDDKSLPYRATTDIEVWLVNMMKRVKQNDLN